MPDPIRLEQDLLAKQAQLQADERALKKKQRENAAALARLHKAQEDARIVEVGTLAKAAGLLSVADTVLEKAFAQIAEGLLIGVPCEDDHVETS